MYGNSGNTWGIVIGIIIGLIVVFLICRELVCWYYKINKLSSQLNEQTQLLKLLLIHSGVSESLINGIIETDLKNKPGGSNDQKYCDNCSTAYHENMKKCPNCGCIAYYK